LYGLVIKAEYAMFTNLKIGSVLAVLASVALGCMTGSASAITAQLAKKCQALTTKAFPPQVPGNPAAGSAKGTGQSQREPFRVWHIPAGATNAVLFRHLLRQLRLAKFSMPEKMTISRC
jgi:hypothetical protein